jgi:glucose-6-phosphate 1-dehydrogenase
MYKKNSYTENMKIFVLFGSTGDLATRYVLPALGVLLQKWVYDQLICVGRRDWARDDFRNFLAPYDDLLNATEKITYVRIDIEKGDFSPLKEEISSQLKTKNQELTTSELTYHLCLSPEYFVPVAQGLASVGLNTPQSRIMIEKPFGHDLKTAIALNLELQHIFLEDQIYRVDHYLGKNYVREMIDYRLGEWENWYTQRISEIQILSREAITLENRGAYFDKNGETRDKLQNHLLQILAFATMLTPNSLDHHDIRDRIFQAISSVAPLLLDPRHDIIIGQYAGYRDIVGVAPDSRTETYIRTRLAIDNPEWMDTKIILETGKALDHKENSITLLFRNGEKKIFAETEDNKNNAYEVLIEKALVRDPSYFVRWDSVRAGWQVVNDLLHCTDNCPILQIYKIGINPTI